MYIINNSSNWQVIRDIAGTVIIGVETLEAQCSRRRHNLRQTNSNFIMYGVRIYSTKMFPEQSNSIPVPEEEEDFSESDWDAILNAKPDPTDLEGQHQDQCLEHQQSHDLERQTSHDRQSHNLERQQSNLKHQRSHERQQSHDSEMPSVIHRDKQTTDSSYRVSVSSSVHFADEPVVCDWNCGTVTMPSAILFTLPYPETHSEPKNIPVHDWSYIDCLVHVELN